jgi:hypothetical protein
MFGACVRHSPPFVIELLTSIIFRLRADTVDVFRDARRPSTTMLRLTRRQKVVIIGWGENALYHSFHVFDVLTWRWLRSTFTPQGVFPRHDGTQDWAYNTHASSFPRVGIVRPILCRM